MPRSIYGLDIGTYEIKVFDKKNKKIWKQKNVIAVKGKDDIFAMGDAAYEMYEKTPDDIRIVFPMQEGAIASFDSMQYLLGTLLNNTRLFVRGSEYLLAVPTDVTEVEKRAFYDLVLNSRGKAKSVRIVERGIVDALGAGVDIWSTSGVMIANFGGGTTELSVLSAGGMVLNRLVKIGGTHLDNAIINLVRRNQDMLIGHSAAENLRCKFGVFEQETDATAMVSGKSILSGIPHRKDISSGLVRAALKEPLEECVNAIKIMIDRTPSDIQKGIFENGLYLTGGIARISGLDSFLESHINLPVHVAHEPEFSSMRGLEVIMSSKVYRKFSYSMLNEDYRWLR
ncbi:MAG: rod shape-determining protein [Lachnospiraceae bacterium]|nr:rod shape-determining protein [Lachnospiraceae bacterium]